MDVIRTPGIVDFNAVSREHYPIGGPKPPGERDGDWSLDRANTANVDTIHMRDRLRHRAADDKKKRREGLDELHWYQHSTGVFLILVTEWSRTSLSSRLPFCATCTSMPRDTPRRRCVFCDQHPDLICRAQYHIAGRTPAAFRAARRHSLLQTRGHCPAAFTCGDVLSDRSTSGGRQLVVEISRQFQQQLATTGRRASLNGHCRSSWRAA